MNIEMYGAFIVLISIMFAAPGPAVLFSIRNGLIYGVRRSMAGLCGNATALILMVCLTAFGYIAVLSVSDYIFKILKFVGALYLIYLGIRMWNTPIVSASEGGNQRNQSITDHELFRQGFLLTSANPKAFAFLGGLLPQFLSSERAIAPQLVVLVPTITMVQVLTFAAYIFLASRAASWIARKKRMRTANRAASASLIGCGVFMASTK